MCKELLLEVCSLQQLADAIGVSNKTISKWECGKGMPEISSITPLCQLLHINVNELLSGERLPEDGYSKRAEENIMNLIQETENNKKKQKNSLSIIVVTVIAVFLAVGFIILSNGGVSMFVSLIDLSTLMPMLAITILFLLATNLGRPFLQAFVIVTGKKKVVSETEIIQARAAIKLVGNTLLGMGIFECCVGFMAFLSAYVNLAYENTMLLAANLLISIPIALISIFYGLIGFLLLLPIKIKLESMCCVKTVKTDN